MKLIIWNWFDLNQKVSFSRPKYAKALASRITSRISGANPSNVMGTSNLNDEIDVKQKIVNYPSWQATLGIVFVHRLVFAIVRVSFDLVLRWKLLQMHAKSDRGRRTKWKKCGLQR